MPARIPETRAIRLLRPSLASNVRSLRILLSLSAAGLLLLALTPWIDAIRPSWLPAVQALVGVWAILGVVVLILALLTRAWWAATASLVAVLAAAVVLVNVNVPRCAPSDRTLSVFALNMEYSRADLDEVTAVLEEREVDLLVMSEVDETFLERLAATEAGSRLQHRSGAAPETPGTEGTVILSERPGKGVDVESEAIAFGQPAMEIDIDKQTVLVRAVHPRPPIGTMLDDWREGLMELGAWQQTIRGRPLIMAGDFNASRAHAPFRVASHRMNDTAGRLPAPTWPSGRRIPPFATIDHILVRGLTVTDQETIEISGTDHRGVWASLAVCGR